MGRYREYAVVVFGVNRRNVLTVTAAVTLLLVGYVIVPAVAVSQSTVAGVRYATALTLFSLWMAWFVAAGVAVWRTGGFGDSN